MDWLPPAPLIERGRQVIAGTLVPPTPGHAATVMLVRDGSDGLEVHMQRRTSSMVFGGMHVFPGGKVDASDYQVPLELPAGWAESLGGGPELAAALVVAACRETFEECGVVLSAGPVTVAAGPRAFADLGVTPDVRLVKPWARWITPEFETKRYDTRFFLARMPRDQRAAFDDAGGEADRSMWIRPEEGLARHRRGEFAMLPPTVFMLTELGDLADADAAIAAADVKTFEPVMPRLVFHDDVPEFVLASADEFE